MKKYQSIYSEAVNYASIPYNIYQMSNADLIDNLLMIVEDENTNLFKRIWSQMSNMEKSKFIKQFKGKYTNDTHDKIYFMLMNLI